MFQAKTAKMTYDVIFNKAQALSLLDSMEISRDTLVRVILCRVRLQTVVNKKND